MPNLLIVESPNKCATLKKILGAGWMVEASVGHITALALDGEDNLGFDITESGVKCRYVPNGDRGKSVIKKLKAAAQKADAIYLATDPDREGESISWHLAEFVCGRKPLHRVTYTQITEAAVKAAIANPRKIDMDLVRAQNARQCLDKLVGYKLSRIVQQANAGKSAGRVQSAALHIVCVRERQIKEFKPVPYWSLQTEYAEGFKAAYLGTEVSQEVEVEVAIDEAADPMEGNEESASKRISSQQEAERIVAIAQASRHEVVEFSGKRSQKSPPPPLTTAALQQAAGVKYGFSSDQVMKIAQELFEGMTLPDGSQHGAITYHRTDSIDLSPEFCDEVQQWLSAHHLELVPAKATKHKNKDGAQGAHEAIRPIDVRFTPETMRSCLNEAQLKVYALIWQRAVASQCAPAELDKSRAVIKAGSTFWEARGSVLRAPGYTKVLGGLGGDVELPQVREKQILTVIKVSSEAKKTSPPGRFSEPQLVQIMERLGVGRPSTYASIMKTLREREYVRVEKKKLVPTASGWKVDETLARVFPAIVDVKFTAKMESALDNIAGGKTEWERYLMVFHFDFFLPALEKTRAAGGK
jgi:DNA topoisomerase I